jgi:DNA-directed RNA polymerase specialized sigma24 family protein
METKRDLVTAAVGGDRDAFASLVRLESRDTYRLAFSILRNTHDAEDAAQEAFVRAWRELPGLRDADRLSRRSCQVNESVRALPGFVSGL